jgi:hypothetical protein
MREGRQRDRRGGEQEAAINGQPGLGESEMSENLN